MGMGADSLYRLVLIIRDAGSASIRGKVLETEYNFESKDPEKCHAVAINNIGTSEPRIAVGSE